MHFTPSETIVLFIVLCSVLILLLVFFIALIIYRYQQKQNAYFKNLEEIKIDHENILLQSQVEMQEKTFQNISIEIHDNIGQKLALAKLLLNTLPYESVEKLSLQVQSSIDIVSQVVNELSDMGRGMSNEIVLQNGIIKATEAELLQIKKTSLYHINFEVGGDTVFLDVKRELILFRVIQECLHNIIKHARATLIGVQLQFHKDWLSLEISDNGKGFDTANANNMGTGIKNIKKRIRLLNGMYTIKSVVDNGTTIKIEIPFI
ncbi:MAG: hypothetical protein H7Y86_20925 [Rhizobacter sp.]|nr:hypothetical protein [Ferruginibacter sp.]